jgi:hypothetical protein
MRYPVVHNFLKWVGPTLVVFLGGCLGLIAAFAAEFPGVKAWAERSFAVAEPTITAPWFVALVVVLIAGYVAGLLWTGQPRHAASKSPATSASSKLPDAESHRNWDTGPYSGPADPEDVEAIVDALASGLNARIRNRSLPPDVAAIVDAKRRHLSEAAMKKQSDDNWTPLDEAVRYLAQQSQWGLDQNRENPDFCVKLAIQLQDALACGDLTARGRKFHLLKGGIKDPPLYPLRPLGKGFWAEARIDAYWPLAGIVRQIAGRKVENVVSKGDQEGVHDVLINQRQLRALWPPRPDVSGAQDLAADERAAMQPSPPTGRAFIGTPGAALFGVDSAKSMIVIDIKNFGITPALNVRWKANAGWYARQPAAADGGVEGALGITEPGHCQNIALLLTQPVHSDDIRRFERGGNGIYALAEIEYEDSRGKAYARRIAYYVDPDGHRLPDRWMLSVCPTGNDETAVRAASQ